MAMTLHSVPWDRARGRLARASEIGDDDFVILFVPAAARSDVHRAGTRRQAAAPPSKRPPGRPRRLCRRSWWPRVHRPPQDRGSGVEKGEVVCTNDDVIRNTAYSWSPMPSAEISSKTGIEPPLHGARPRIIGLSAARAALERSGRSADEIAAVIFCSCTNTRLIPSVATWISGQLGIYQTHASFDLVAACAGFPMTGRGIRI